MKKSNRYTGSTLVLESDVPSIDPSQSLAVIDGSDKVLTIWDETNPRSVFNLLPQSVKNHLTEAFKAKPEIFNMDEYVLYRTLSRNNIQPSPTDNTIRMKFWIEYDDCQMNMKKNMDITRIISGICSSEYWYGVYLKSHTRLAWMLCKPVGYATKTEEALEFAAEQIRDILAQPHVVNGKLDTRIADTKMKAYAFLHNIVKGAVVQKTMQLNVHTTSKSAANALMDTMATNNMESINDKLARLRRRERQLENGGIGTAKTEAVSIVDSQFTEANKESGVEESGPTTEPPSD